MQHAWTASLDRFALLRMGKAMSNALPLISAGDERDTDVLDETDGWIGDEDDGEGGRLLEVGGSGCVMPKARYRTNREPKPC